ncbi:phosphatase PAP2 family protein [Pseudogulbenkiania sp. MAI-1]|uniref:phosphatase PAP2 family protein n=1 Tax=Pseudogulbenkiania sp. MAI-1 TaxID=990370 RepID=UPI00045E9A44|nr:phosphatase PAP2 family protein [Pseudogulbenkiania sp. MAI-1]
MNLSTLTIHLILSGVLIVGAYQFYFWCQRNPLFEPRQLASPLDERIPYLPQWVWIYSLLYYPAILYVNVVLQSAEQFTRVAFSYLALLALQMTFFVLLPVRTPPHWRMANAAGSWSERFLALVQRYDAESNSFPSMHTSVAMLTALHLVPELGLTAFAFPALIGLSCLFTKQHYLVDIPAGAALGWFSYALYAHLLAG